MYIVAREGVWRKHGGQGEAHPKGFAGGGENGVGVAATDHEEQRRRQARSLRDAGEMLQYGKVREGKEREGTVR